MFLRPYLNRPRLNRFLWSIFPGTPSNSAEHDNKYVKIRNIYGAFEAGWRFDLNHGLVMKKLIFVSCIFFLLTFITRAQSADSLQPPGSGDGTLFDGRQKQFAVSGSSAISGTFT